MPPDSPMPPRGVDFPPQGLHALACRGRSAWRALLHATGLDERRCVLCLTPYSPDPAAESAALPLCPTCRAGLVRHTGARCLRCGDRVSGWAGEVRPNNGSDQAAPLPVCGTCLASPPPWTEFRFYGEFSGTLRALLHRAKYHADSAALNLLGTLMAETCADLPVPDAVAAMPLHAVRLRHRGYNQSREMARPVSRMFGVPLRDDLILRQRHTRPQTGLNRQERLRNLDHVFLGLPAATGLHILLVDDTSTTGTSLRRATEALLAAGAARVDVAVAAHASLNHPTSDDA